MDKKNCKTYVFDSNDLDKDCMECDFSTLNYCSALKSGKRVFIGGYCRYEDECREPKKELKGLKKFLYKLRERCQRSANH